MRKPKFLAMTLAAALVAGAVFEAPVMTARAEETAGSTSETVSPGNSGATVSPGNSGTTVTPGDEGGSQTPSTPGEESGTTDVELIAPTNLTWTTLSYPSENNRWGVTLTVPNWEELSQLEDTHVCVELYQEGEKIGSAIWSSNEIQKNLEVDVSRWIFETGDCYVIAYEFLSEGGVWNPERLEKSDNAVSMTQHYEVPEQRLGTVTDITWNPEQTGIFYFTPVEGEISYYEILLYSETDAEWVKDGMMCHVSSWINPEVLALEYWENGRCRWDVSRWLQMYGEGVYHVTVRAYSNDIDVCANGYESDYSVPLDTYAKTEEVSGKIADAIAANDGNPVAAAAAVRAAAGSVNEAATQMQISETVLGQIKGLETAYNDAQEITVAQTVTAEAEALGVSAEDISIVGAGFNAEAGGTVTLKIGVPSREEMLPSGYRRGVQLDISLDGAQTDENGRLEMPVTITMPAPVGVDLSKLTLFHYHNGSRNRVAFRYDSAANTITFTVTSFSTFLFTEEGTDETQPDDGNIPSGDGNTGTDDGNTPSGGNTSDGSTPSGDGTGTDSGNIPSGDGTGTEGGNTSSGGNTPSGDSQSDGNTPSGNNTSSNSTASGSAQSGSSSTSSVTAEKKTPAPLTYVVQRGDNMYKIARKHGLTLAQLVALNPQIKNPARIYAGQVLIVGYTDDGTMTDAANAEYYTVKKGDSLYRIAARNGLKLVELRNLNPKLFAQKFIFAGQKVRVK